MKFLSSALVVALLAFTASLVSAQDRFGDAVIEKGELTIVRQGNNLKFKQGNQPVPVFVADVLRVGEASSVVLKTREKSTISMGANAVFQVKPFQYQEKQGFARMLFGRFRSLVQGLSGGETVNAKTATAVIGVKGTENLASIRPRGDTMLVGVENVTTIQNPNTKKKSLSMQGGHVEEIEVVRNTDQSPDFILIPTTEEPVRAIRVQDGGESPVGPNNLGLTLGDNPPITGPAPPEVLDELGKNLDSPPPGDPGAGNFPGQNGLLRSGLVNQDQLDEGEQEDVEGGEGGEGAGGEQGPNPEVSDPNLDDPAQNLFRGDVQIEFQQ
jgi:hypothetical protein